MFIMVTTNFGYKSSSWSTWWFIIENQVKRKLTYIKYMLVPTHSIVIIDISKILSYDMFCGHIDLYFN